MLSKNGKDSALPKKARASKPKSVRGSGYTYDEGKQQTDKSVEIKKTEEDQVVQLPDLGKPERK